LVKPDGNSWTSETIQQKYEGHAKILEGYVANDPKKDPRWVFYLAQSYRDAGNKEKSLEWYQKRIGMTNGYWEEIYFSALMVANLKSQLGHPIPEVIDAFLKCGKYNKHRIEHLIPVILYYQSIKEFDIAYIIGLRAIQCEGKTPMPQSSLFVDPSVYQWKIFDLHSLSCWYSGRKEESVRSYKRLLKAMDKGFVPKDQLERVKQNKKFFLGK
jgi:tetratricopeptide (TPR) repeat protein